MRQEQIQICGMDGSGRLQRTISPNGIHRPSTSRSGDAAVLEGLVDPHIFLVHRGDGMTQILGHGRNKRVGDNGVSRIAGMNAIKGKHPSAVIRGEGFGSNAVTIYIMPKSGLILTLTNRIEETEDRIKDTNERLEVLALGIAWRF